MLHACTPTGWLEVKPSGPSTSCPSTRWPTQGPVAADAATPPAAHCLQLDAGASGDCKQNAADAKISCGPRRQAAVAEAHAQMPEGSPRGSSSRGPRRLIKSPRPARLPPRAPTLIQSRRGPQPLVVRQSARMYTHTRKRKHTQPRRLVHFFLFFWLCSLFFSVLFFFFFPSCFFIFLLVLHAGNPARSAIRGPLPTILAAMSDLSDAPQARRKKNTWWRHGGAHRVQCDPPVQYRPSPATFDISGRKRARIFGAVWPSAHCVPGGVSGRGRPPSVRPQVAKKNGYTSRFVRVILAQGPC